jgi:hypothetical protein
MTATNNAFGSEAIQTSFALASCFQLDSNFFFIMEIIKNGSIGILRSP